MSIFGKIFGFKNQDSLIDSSISKTSKEFKKIVNDRLFSRLKEHGFKRKGNNFKKENLDLDYYIQTLLSGIKFKELEDICLLSSYM